MYSRPLPPFVTGDVHADVPESEGSPRDVMFSGYGPRQFVFDGQHKLIRGFDLATDRAETTNRVSDPPDVVDRFDDALDRLRTD